MIEERIEFVNKYGLKLSGIINVKNVTREIVVISHASGSYKNSRVTYSLSNYLSDKNINNFRFDYTSCGDSEGSYLDVTISKFVEDLECVLNLLSSKGFTKFILFGYSLGARISTQIDVKKI